MSGDDQHLNPQMLAYLESQQQKLQTLQRQMNAIEQSLPWRLLAPWHYVQDLWRKHRAGRHLTKRGVR